jgi:hypothetical protein
MRSSALQTEDLFPKEVPSFQLPTPPVSDLIEAKLEAITKHSETYFKERETAISFFETDIEALDTLVRRYSLGGGDPKLDELIEQAGSHMAKTRAEVLPQIDEALALRKKALALRPARVRTVMVSLVDRNLALMRRYLRAVEAIYERLIGLRDLSIQQSVSGLTQAAWAGLWDDED